MSHKHRYKIPDNTGEDVGRGEFIAGGSASLFSPYGHQCEGSSKS